MVCLDSPAGLFKPCALREAFEAGGHDAGVVFIETDAQRRVIPCSPNKILLSRTTTLRPHHRLLPVGFQTGYRTGANGIGKAVAAIDGLVRDAVSGRDELKPMLVTLEAAVEIVERISSTCAAWSPGYEWDKEAFIASMQHLSSKCPVAARHGKVWLLVRRDRYLKRIREGGRFQNTPDTVHIEGKLAKECATDFRSVVR